jgi:hypothetical protein
MAGLVVVAVVVVFAFVPYLGRRGAGLRAESAAELTHDQKWRNEPASGTIPSVPSRLVTACTAGGRVVFLGSGVGAQLGLPTWTESLS